MKHELHGDINWIIRTLSSSVWLVYNN